MAEPTFEETIADCQNLLDQYQDRNDVFGGMDAMARNDWQFDEDIPDVRTVIDTTPSDALDSATTALSSLMPVFNVIPHGKNLNELERANSTEQVICYCFKEADRRGVGTVRRDVTISALRYDMICVMVEDLLHKFPKEKSKWSKQQKRAFRQGRFLIRVYNPSYIFPKISSAGLVGVLHAELFPADDAVKNWKLYEGNEEWWPKISEAVELIEEQAAAMEDPYFIQFYWMDDDKVRVWGKVVDGVQEIVDSSGDIRLVDSDNELDFFPWVIRVGGSRLDTNRKYQVMPLLAKLFHSGTWENINLFGSLVFSEPIRRLREPKDVAKTTDGRLPNVDRSDGSTVGIRSNEDYTRLSPSQMDPEGPNVVEKLRASANRSTGASILGDTATLKSNTPFSTYQAMLQVALGMLDAFKENMENAYVDIVLKFFEWSEFTDRPIEGLRTKAYSQSGAVIRGQGEELLMQKKDFDINWLYKAIECEVKSKTPTDYRQQIDAAQNLVAAFGYSKRQALEDIGKKNPDLILDEGRLELMQDAVFQNRLQEKAAEVQLRIQRKQMAMQNEFQMQAQAQMMAQQEEMQGAQTQEMQGAMGGQGGFQGMGGPPPGPGRADPFATREQITGQDYFAGQEE